MSILLSAGRKIVVPRLLWVTSSRFVKATVLCHWVSSMSLLKIEKLQRTNREKKTVLVHEEHVSHMEFEKKTVDDTTWVQSTSTNRLWCKSKKKHECCKL